MQNKNNGEKGLSLVEFAIILPLFFVLLFGIIEFGVLMYDKAILTNASREGARAGVLMVNPENWGGYNHPDEDHIKQVVLDYAKNYLVSFKPDESTFNTTNVNIFWLDKTFNSWDTGWESYQKDYKDTISGDKLVVEVEYEFKFLTFSKLITLLDGSFKDGIPLNAKTTMRLE